MDDAIEAAQDLVDTDFTDGSAAALDTALAEALAVKGNRYSTTPEYTAATAALVTAIDALIPLTAATPTASPAAGQQATGAAITLSCATANAIIRYTLDGSTPDEDSDAYDAIHKPTIPIGGVTLKAKAFKGSMTASEALSVAYTTAKAATPTVSPATGAVANGTALTFSCSTSGVEIRFTTDGTDPTNESTLYNPASKPTVGGACTVKAKAFKEGLDPSDELSAAYTLTGG